MPGRPLAEPIVARRTVLTGALGSVVVTSLLSACDHGDDIGAPTPSASAPAATESTSAPAQTPDEALVDSTVEQLTAAVGVLTTARKLAALRRPLAPLVKAHRRHLQVLEGEPGGRAAPPPADPGSALQAVRQSERRLQAALVDSAGRAQSGALAKLLASMSASVTQHLAALPAEAEA